MSGDERGAELLLAEVGQVRVAIPVAQVVGVDVEGDCPRVDGWALLDQPQDEVPPRRVRLRGAAGPFDLEVGAGIRVQRLPAHEVQDLPTFLAGLRAHGLAGLAWVGGQLALVLDPAAMDPAP